MLFNERKRTTWAALNRYVSLKQSKKLLVCYLCRLIFRSKQKKISFLCHHITLKHWRCSWNHTWKSKLKVKHCKILGLNIMDYDLIGLSSSTEEWYRPAHWPGKWAAISLIILEKETKRGKQVLQKRWVDTSTLRVFWNISKKKKKKDRASEQRGEMGRVTKRAASWGPGGSCNRPGQHFTCVTSCWPQQEERGMAWWPAGAQGLSDWHRRLCTGQMDKCRHTCINTHTHTNTNTTSPLQTCMNQVKCRVRVTQNGA